MSRSETIAIRLFLGSSIADRCWEWTGAKTAFGYGRYAVNNSSSPAHRIAYKEFCGPIPDGFEVCHRCDNPSCINPLHLFLGSHQDNMTDMKTKGRAGRACGEQQGSAKLKNADIIMIRSSSLPSTKLGPMLGVSATRIQQIRKGKGWAHVQVA